MRELPRLSSAIRVLIIAGVALGFGAEAASFGLADPRSWIPDLIVGWVCIGLGAVAAVRRPESRTGLIVAAAGFAWFIGNFSGAPVAAVGLVATQLALIHRAILIHATLTLPTGRIVGRVQLAVIFVAYLTWSLPAIADVPIVALALCSVVVLAAAFGLRTSAPPFRSVRLVALGATVLLGAAFGLASVLHATVPSGALDWAALFLDEAAIAVAAVALTIATLLPRLQFGQVTDLIVEASRSRSDVVRASLADALGDPSVEIGYWHGGTGRYRDASGEAVALPAEDDERAVLRVDIDDHPAAVLVHDPAALETSALTDAVRTATVLASANARLRSDVLDQLAEVRASRRRLLLAEDAELGRLEARVNRGPLRRSQDLSASLATMEAAAQERGAASVAHHVRRARSTLTSASAELEALAQGLHPVVLDVDGLATALRALAERFSLAIEIKYEVGVLPEPVARALYYACAEALTNVVKHARASAAQIRVWEAEARVHLLVMDDGGGGAEPRAGSGLRGIKDRVEALDGTVQLTSGVGTGTRLLVHIPLTIPDR